MNSEINKQEKKGDQEGFLFKYILNPWGDFLHYLLFPKELPVARFNLFDPKAKGNKVVLAWTKIPLEESEDKKEFIYDLENKTKNNLMVTYIPYFMEANSTRYTDMWYTTSTCKKHEDNCLLVEYGGPYWKTWSHHIKI